MPIIVNTAFLKLADAFSSGYDVAVCSVHDMSLSSNFIRFAILRVFERCKDQVPLITNVDEVLNRITVVLHSNDPVARAVTLRCRLFDISYSLMTL